MSFQKPNAPKSWPPLVAEEIDPRNGGYVVGWFRPGFPAGGLTLRTFRESRISFFTKRD